MTDKNDDEEDNLAPAGALRVVVGLILMASGSLFGLIGGWRWLNILGWMLFFGSFFVMLKQPQQGTRSDSNH